MVREVSYKPSDLKALDELQKLKASLGIQGAISTKEEWRKAYYYFRSIGWPMSMLSCDPDVYGGADPVKKARCMLYNEMRSWEVSQQVRGNEEQLKKYGSAYRSTYEHNKAIFEREKKAIEGNIKSSSMKKIEEFAKGKPLPLPAPRPLPAPAPSPRPRKVERPEEVVPLIAPRRVPGTVAPGMVEANRDKLKVVIVGGLILVGVGWWLLGRD